MGSLSILITASRPSPCYLIFLTATSRTTWRPNTPKAFLSNQLTSAMRFITPQLKPKLKAKKGWSLKTLVNQRVQCRRSSSSTSSLPQKLLQTGKFSISGKKLRRNSKKILQPPSWKFVKSLRRSSKRLRKLMLTNWTLMSQSCLRRTCSQMLLKLWSSGSELKTANEILCLLCFQLTTLGWSTSMFVPISRLKTKSLPCLRIFLRRHTEKSWKGRWKS